MKYKTNFCTLEISLVCYFIDIYLKKTSKLLILVPKITHLPYFVHNMNFP